MLINIKKSFIILLLFNISYILPDQRLANALNDLTNTLRILKNKLIEESLNPDYLDVLPNEIIQAIIDKQVPNSFKNTEEVVATINSMVSFMNTNKRLKEQFGPSIQRKINEIIATHIPKEFQHASQIINSINYLQSLSTTNKTIEEQIKTKLRKAIEASKDVFQERDLERFAIARGRTNPPILQPVRIRVLDKALLKAFKKNNFTVMKFLLENYARITTEYYAPIDRSKEWYSSSFTLLMRALQEKDIRKVNLLLSFIKKNDDDDNAANILYYAHSNETPFFIAFQANFIEGIEALFKAAQKHAISQLNTGLLRGKELIQAQDTFKPFIEKYKVQLASHLSMD